jgi:hypothetical protein
MASAGGFFYHLRALHASRLRWRPFRDAISAWLAEWTASGPLVLVGPSAAYCMDDTFFARWSELTVLEPDPLARFLLERRLHRLGVAVRFIVEDELLAPLLDGRPGLDARLHEAPGASVLFANILGQLPFLVHEARFDSWYRAWRARLLPELGERPWASFHDRVSTSTRPELETTYTSPARLDDAALGARFFGEAKGRVELHSHAVEPLFPTARPHTYAHWEVERGSHHLIEAVRSP